MSPEPEPEGGFEAAPEEVALRRRPGIKWRRYPADVLPAWVADMDFPVAPPIRRALEELLALGALGYPDWRGGSPLREAMAARMAERYGWHADPGGVRELTDIIQGVQLALELGTARGDAVALHTPTYPPFLRSIEQMGRRLVPIPMEEEPGRWSFDAERAESAVAAAGCRAMIVVNPHNPTGRVFTKAELASLAGIAERHDLLVVADEVHAELVYRGAVHRPFASLGEETARRTVTLTSATKAFNLAGVRCAVAHFGAAALLARRDAQPSDLHGQPSVLGVAATMAAWQQGDSWLAGALSHLDANRRHLAGRLAAELPAARHHPPEATYLAWIDLRQAGGGGDPAATLLDRARVALSAGVDFGAGGEGFARLNFATSRRLLDEILDRVIAALSG